MVCINGPESTMRALFLLAVATLCAPMTAPAIDLDGLCLDCHQPRQTRGEVPLIEGQEQDYLRNQLRRFRDRHRDGFPMGGVAAGLDDVSLEALSAVLAARPWRDSETGGGDGSAERGAERVAQLACASCHGEAFLGAGDIPRLAGQQAGYLQRQIEAFAQLERHHPPSGIGARMVVLEGTDAMDIAAYLASRRQ